MRRVYYNKLVRDNVPKKIKALKQAYEARTITNDQEFEQELLKKVIEEASALAHVRSKDSFLKEYGDLAVVLDALANHLGFSKEDLGKAVKENIKEKGGFTDKQFLMWSEDKGYKSNESVQGT